jgi:hypothetical protein
MCVPMRKLCTGESTTKKSVGSRQTSVYISYAPSDARSRAVAEYIRTAVLDKYNVPCVMLGPEDGTLNFIDFEEQLKV